MPSNTSKNVNLEAQSEKDIEKYISSTDNESDLQKLKLAAIKKDIEGIKNKIPVTAGLIKDGNVNWDSVLKKISEEIEKRQKKPSYYAKNFLEKRNRGVSNADYLKKIMANIINENKKSNTKTPDKIKEEFITIIDKESNLLRKTTPDQKSEIASQIYRDVTSYSKNLKTYQEPLVFSSKTKKNKNTLLSKKRFILK